MEIACDSILSGKAKVMIAGGFDDFSEEGSFELCVPPACYLLLRSLS